MSSQPLRILVLADTHDHLPPRLEALAAGTDEIWHLGDVCEPRLLDQFREIGPPVTVVAGNCDREPGWPLLADLERNGVRFRLVHIPPQRVPNNVDVLLHGHTHVPRDEVLGGVRFLNPGCVTRPSRGAPASIAHLAISVTGELTWELTRLR
jgi:putative phosphoesterase